MALFAGFKLPHLCTEAFLVDFVDPRSKEVKAVQVRVVYRTTLVVRPKLPQVAATDGMPLYVPGADEITKAQSDSGLQRLDKHYLVGHYLEIDSRRRSKMRDFRKIHAEPRVRYNCAGSR